MRQEPKNMADFARWIVMLALAAIVSYFTSLNAVTREIADIRARQEAQFSEVLRRLDSMQVDIRELRGR